MNAPVIGADRADRIICNRSGSRSPARNPRPARAVAAPDQAGRPHHCPARGARRWWRRRCAARCPGVHNRSRLNARSIPGEWRGRLPFPPVAAPPVPPVDADAVARAATLLGKAERPLIVVGAGALNAGPEVQAIAELLEAPVSSFRRGRGVIPTTHRLAVSFTEGHRFWKTADAVLAIGTRLYWQQSNWGVDDKLPIVRLDIDAQEINRFRHPACALIGDAAATCCGRCSRSCRRTTAPARPYRGAGFRARLVREKLSRQEPQMGFLRAIRAALPDDGIYVEDVTQVGFASRLAFPVTRRGHIFRPGIRTRWAGATARRWARKPPCRGARWWRWRAMAGSCTRPRNWRPPCGINCQWLLLYSMMARSGMCAASSRCSMATG